MDRGSPKGAFGDQLLSRRVHAAASTQRTDSAKSRGTLQPVISLGGRNADGGRRQSQTSWSRDRIFRDPTHLGPESDSSLSPALCRSIRRVGSWPHALDTWLRHILPTCGGTASGLPWKVHRRIGAGLHSETFELFRSHPAPGRSQEFCPIHSEATPTGMGRLYQAFLWWPGTGSPLSGALYPSCGHLQSPARFFRRGSSHIPLEGLCARQQETQNDRIGRRVRPAIPLTRSTERFRPHSAFWFHVQFPASCIPGTLPPTARHGPD